MDQENTERAMSNKEKRVMEAHRLRYMEDLDNQEIADRLGLALQTVHNYFSSTDSDRFKRFYSDQERFKLEKSLEQDIRDGDQLANNLLARAIQHDEASPSTLARASKLALENRKKKIELLQELGIIDKPDSTDDTDDTSGDVVFEEELVESREQLQELEEQG